jgi:hypothetical protein
VDNEDDLAERVDDLEDRVAALEARLDELDPESNDEIKIDGVSVHGGELVIRCHCGFTARGFASASSATDALASHQRQHT